MPERIPVDVPATVVIARSTAAVNAAGLASPLVAILPDYDPWNDYGRQFFAKMHVRPAEGEPVQFHCRIMFVGYPRSEVAFDEMFQANGPVFPIEQVDRPFVSMIPDVDRYRLVIELLGFELGVSALRKLRDAVVVRAEDEDEEALALIADEEFHIGVMRNPGAYDALRRGGRYFRPGIPPTVEDAAVSFAFTTNLKSADNPYTLRFDFERDNLFRDRSSILVGRNGVGKTQLLKSIVDGLHDGHADDVVLPHFFPAIAPSRVLVFSSVPTDPFPRTIGAWRGIDYEYFAVNAVREDGGDPLLAALVACKKSEDRHLFGPNRDQSRLDVIRDALEPLGLWTRLHLPLRPRRQGDDLPGVLEIDGQSFILIDRGANELNSIKVIQQIDWTRSPVVLDQAMQPRRLSSGEYAMLRFAAQAAAAIEQGSMLLLDEPETHLHPNFLSDLMEILDNLLQSTGSIAIIATHSAYVVREAPRRRVNVLSIADRVVQVDTPRMQTFGANVDTISQFVFNDTTLSHAFQKTLARWAEEVGQELGIEGIVAAFGAELNPESLSFVARHLQQIPRAEEHEE